jgi:ATP-dependent Lon protease
LPLLLDARHNDNIHIIEIDHIDQLTPEVAAILARMIDSQAEMAHIQYIPTTTIFVFAARIATAIPQIIRERVELVMLPSLTDAERLLIAREVLLPLQIQIYGLDLAEVQIDASLIESVVQNAKTEGMAEITDWLAQWCRSAALQVIAHQQGLEVGNRPIVME